MKQTEREFYLGDKNLPVGDVKQEYTPKMIKEMIACSQDIIKFTKHFYITSLDRGKEKIKLFRPQKRIIKAFVKNRFNIILSSRQAGKALDVNTPIPTPSGWTIMGKLQDNDIIFDNNGNPTKVVKAWDIMENRPCYKITFDTGEVITADEEHLWFTQNMSERRKKLNGSKKTTKEIYKTLYKTKTNSEPNHRIPRVMSGVKYNEDNWIYIKNIEPVDSIPVRCITVDSEDSMFLCGNTYIPTSNTTMTTIYALWVTCFQKDKGVLIVANKEDTAKEILSRIKMAYEQLPNWLKPGVEEWAKTEVKFSNDSRIRISTTSSSAARGLSINVCIIDEMAHIPDHIIKEFWNSVIPVISSSNSTKLFVVSTPNGAGNLFYKIYSGVERGDPKFSQWHYERVDWWEIPGRGKKWEIDQRSLLAAEDKSFSQEFGCKFLETGNSAVDSSLLDMFRSMVHDPLYTFEDGNYKVWKEPDSTHLYAIGVDVGEGIGQAASVANIIDLTDLTNIEVVATYHNNKIDPFHFGELLYKIANQWGRPMLAIERNNCGGQVIDALKEKYNYHNIIDHSPKTMSSHGNYYSRLGIYSHTNAKYQGIMNMRYWVNSLKAVKVYDIGLIQELETFVRYPNGTWKAKQGDYIYDDRVMSLVWGLFVLENEIAEKYYDIPSFDDRGKPSKITPVNVEPSKYFNLNTDFVNNPNGPMPTVINPSFGLDPEGVDALEQQGWVRHE